MTINVEIDADTGIPVGYVTLKEFAEKLCVDKRTPYIWISRGKIDYLKIGDSYFIKDNTQYPIDKRTK